MGGLVKEAAGDSVKVHLFGRLGVITVPSDLISSTAPLEPGHELEFYFSYIQIVGDPYDYDCSDMAAGQELQPCLLGGKLTEVNDTAVTVEIMNHLGTIRVPRRWIFTSYPLKEGLDAEFYFSRMNVVRKREIPKEFI